MISVFVSSTFKDLAEHRAAVRDALRQASFEDIAMEHLGARDERPLAECQRLVSSADYFVGIYAHRYGHIPAGESVSITESEYIAAGRSPRLVYLVRPDFPWNPDLIDQGEPKARLESLKARLKECHTCRDFESPDNLARHVVADLAREVRKSQLPAIGEETRSSSPEKWTNKRRSRYAERRFTELVHVLEPSDEPGQEFDISLYLFRHRADNEGGPFGLNDVVKAEFYLGSSWNDRVFTIHNDDPGRYIGLRVSAYGTFMCLCRVTFSNGQTVVLDRYIDFETEAPALRQEVPA